VTKLTARERVLLRLRYADGGWLSGIALADVGGYRFGARIHELRQDGYVIERRTDPHSAVDQYRLVESVQLRIAL
jgi:biotin operon repressor